MRGTTAALGMALLLCACGSGVGNDSPVRARSALSMGEKVTFPNGETVQVHGYVADVPSEGAGAAAGATRSFAVVDVEACAGLDGVASAEAAKFGLEMPDGGRVAPAAVIAKEPPLRTPSAPGECSRGTITYEVGSGQRPAAVSLLVAERTVRWKVG